MLFPQNPYGIFLDFSSFYINFSETAVHSNILSKWESIVKMSKYLIKPIINIAHSHKSKCPLSKWANASLWHHCANIY